MKIKKHFYKNIYKILLTIAKTSNWKVKEINIKELETEGTIEITSRTIEIEKNLFIERKCITLAHELIGHAYQADCGDKKYKRFFNNSYFPNNKKNLRYIERIEIEASKLAADFLEILGWKKAHKEFEELNKKELKGWLRESWKDTYFK